MLSKALGFIFITTMQKKKINKNTEIVITKYENPFLKLFKIKRNKNYSKVLSKNDKLTRLLALLINTIVIIISTIVNLVLYNFIAYKSAHSFLKII